MTNEELLQDLKQFISATVSQQTVGLATKEDLADLRNDITGLRGDVDTLRSDVDSLRNEMNDRFDEILKSEIIKDHERRITRLEHKLA